MRRVMLLLLFTAGVICSSVLLRAQGPSSEVQILNKTYDSTNNALRINAVATGGGAGSPNFYNADQLYNLIFDNTNTALRVNCVLGCGGGSGSPGGASGTLQFNNAGAFGGAANAIYNSVSGISTLALADKGGQVFNVKAYGAVGNGILLYNCAITTGTAALTCSTASFSSADVGKAIEVDGAAASAGNIITTISSVTDATHVVIGTNAATTTSTANVVYGTDDSTAIQGLINTLFAAHGGAIYFPNGVYILNGAVSALNAMLDIPPNPWNVVGAPPRIALEFRGPNNMAVQEYWGAPSVSGAVIYGMTAVPAAGSLLLADPVSSSTSGVNVSIKNLEFITPPDPNYTALNLQQALDMNIRGVAVVANHGPTKALPATPIHTSGIGIYSGGNSGNSLILNTTIQGIYECFLPQDHSTLVNVYAQSCSQGFHVHGGSHGIFMFNALAQNSTHGIDLGGTAKIFAVMDFETDTFDIFDDGTTLGSIWAMDPAASIASKSSGVGKGLMLTDGRAGYIGASVNFISYTFATLPTGTNGLQVYCSDCKNAGTDGATFDSAAAAAGTGTTVLFENGAWRVH